MVYPAVMADDKPISVFGEEVDPDKPSPVYLVPPEDRKDSDDDGSDETNALTPNETDRGEGE